MIAAALLVAACGASKDTTASTSIMGTFEVTSIDCNGLAAGVPADLAVRIVSGRTYSLTFSSDGSTMTVAMADPSCTWGSKYSVAYISDARFSVIGFGSYTCTPSAAACASLLAVENPKQPQPLRQ